MFKHFRLPLALWVICLVGVLALAACGDESETSNQVPLILDLAYPAEVQPGQVVRLTALSKDPDGDDDSLTYQWNIKSGGGEFSRQMTRTIPSVTYTAPTELGLNFLEIVITDPADRNAAFTFEITVRNILPPPTPTPEPTVPTAIVPPTVTPMPTATPVPTQTPVALKKFVLRGSGEPFDDLLVVEAIILGVPWFLLTEELFKGLDISVAVEMSNKRIAEDVRVFTFDPERAQELLTEAGFPDGFAAFWPRHKAGPLLLLAHDVEDNLSNIGIQLTTITNSADFITTGLSGRATLELTLE